MNRNEKKQLIIGIIILILFIIVVIIVNFIINYKPNKYLIIKDNIILEKTSKGWEQLTKVNPDILKQKYTVDTGNKKYENSQLNYASDVWYYIDENYKNIDGSSVRIAYSKMDDIRLADYIIEDIDETDYEIMETLLEEEGYKNTNSFLNNTQKIVLDLDNDGNNETIYTTTNASLEYTGEEEISIMFLVKNDQIVQVIDTNTSGPYTIMEILDLDNDGKYEMIVNKGDIDIMSFDSCYQIYKKTKEKWKLEKDCI